MTGETLFGERIIPLAKNVFLATKRYTVPASVILCLLTASQRTEVINPFTTNTEDGKNSPITTVIVDQDLLKVPSIESKFNDPPKPKRLLASSFVSTATEGNAINKIVVSDFRGKEIAGGDTYSISTSSEYPSLLDPAKPANEQQDQLNNIGFHVNDGNVMAAGKVANINGSFDIFPISQILSWTINADNVAIATISDLNGITYNIAASDLLIAIPDVDIRNMRWKNPTVKTLFWQYPSEFDRAVAETNNILSGESSRYKPVVGLSPVDGDIKTKHISTSDILEKIANHILNIEMNDILQLMIDRIENEGGRKTLNTFIRNTLKPHDFVDNQLPQFEEGELENFVVIPKDNWGGGGATSPAITIVGPYSDKTQLTGDAARAGQQLLHDDSHEQWHIKIQGLSKYKETSMQEEREGFKKFEDPQSALTHVSMGLGEVVIALQLGVDGVYPNNQVMFLADRLIRSGMTPRDVVILLSNVSAHGDPNGGILARLNNSRLPGDPPIEDILTRESDIEGLAMRPEAQDDVLQAIAVLAEIIHPIPPYGAEKDVFSPPKTSPFDSPSKNPVNNTKSLSPVK